MKDNSATYPNELFTWMENTPFSKLSPGQKTIVLTHLAEQEYNDMHQAAKSIQTAAKKVQPKGKAAIKAELLANFTQPKAKIIALNTPVSLGKVAAVVVLLLSTIVWQYLTPTKPETITTYITKTDTLLVEAKTPVEEVLHDTFYIKEEAPAKKQTTPKAKFTANNTPAPKDIYILGTDELNKTYNQPKHNSFKNDTLASKYGFVSL